MSDRLNERGEAYVRYLQENYGHSLFQTPAPFTRYMRPIEFTVEYSKEEWFGPPSPTDIKWLVHDACWNGEVYGRAWPSCNQACAVCGEWMTDVDNDAGLVWHVPSHCFKKEPPS